MREALEIATILLTAGGGVAAYDGRTNLALLLTIAAATTGFMSLWSIGTSLLRLPSLRRE